MLSLQFPNDSMWIIGGVFNVIVDPDEKLGTSPYNRKAILEFTDFQNRAAVHDLGYNGSVYTWSNNNPEELIWERLDRILINSLEDGSKLKVIHEIRVFSDHCPLVCVVDTIVKFPSNFKMQATWFNHEDFEDLIKKTWDNASVLPPLQRFLHKLRSTRCALKAWNSNTFGRVQNRAATSTMTPQDLEDNLNPNSD